MDRATVAKFALFFSLLLTTLGMGVYALSRVFSMITVFSARREPPWIEKLLTSPTLYLSLMAIGVGYLTVSQLSYQSIQFGERCLDREDWPIAFWSIVVVETTIFAFLVRYAIVLAI